jgi:hypothetical protein
VEHLLPAVDGAHGQLVSRRIRGLDAPQPHLGPIQLLAQRHHHVARLERARGGAGQQRGVEQEVDVRDERDARAVARQPALETSRRVQATEATSGYQDVVGHGSRG